MNNFERIKQMSVDEMADLLYGFTFYEEYEVGEDNTKIKQWLLQECE